MRLVPAFGIAFKDDLSLVLTAIPVDITCKALLLAVETDVRRPKGKAGFAGPKVSQPPLLKGYGVQEQPHTEFPQVCNMRALEF